MTTCETCRFWVRSERNLGECRLHAPMPALLGDGATAPLNAWWTRTRAKEGCGEHQPRAAAPGPAPEADTGALRAALSECADEMLGTVWLMEHHNYSDVSKQFRDCIVRARAALSATPPRPALDPETRQLLEDAAEGLSRVANDFHPAWHRKAGICKKHAEDIRAHLAAHGGGDE